MKKILAAISVVMLLLASAVSCQKEASSERQPGQSVFEVTRYTFAISVNGNHGFDDGETRAVKTGWENGDKIFLFFKPSGKNMLTDTYATMVYDGTSWTTHLTGSSSLESGGELSAVYAPYLGSTVVPTYEDGKWNIASGDVYYSCTVATYSVNSGTVTASLPMKIPNDYVQFYIKDVSSADILTCDNVDSYNDITIDSSLGVNSKTKKNDGKMTGREFSTSDNGIVFFGRLKSTLPKHCHFSVTKDGVTYRRVIQEKQLAHKAYNLGNFSTNQWTPILLGKVSISDNEQVRFAHGNLFWNGSAFEFEKSQSTYPTSWDAQHVGHFFWVQDATKSYAETYGATGSSNDKLFTNVDGFTVYGQTGWRTLSFAEWKYIFENRTSGGFKCPVTVDGVTGLVIAPDDYDLTQGIDDTYDAQQWATAENQGFVFLPNKANIRTGTEFNDQAASHYWSSTNSGADTAGCVYITDDDQMGDDNFDDAEKRLGRSIRLVKKVTK